MASPSILLIHSSLGWLSTLSGYLIGTMNTLMVRLVTVDAGAVTIQVLYAALLKQLLSDFLDRIPLRLIPTGGLEFGLDVTLNRMNT